nr:MAG TPA: hypothetical protein [Caudoviricetes sp.]DAM28780.1 MAG TPA: hypothetical protein [Caudoviricetes sp.]
MWVECMESTDILLLSLKGITLGIKILSGRVYQ